MGILFGIIAILLITTVVITTKRILDSSININLAGLLIGLMEGYAYCYRWGY